MTSELTVRLLDGFAQHFGGAPGLVVRAPGRVNLIGEHTDYNDGFAMPIAISRGTQVAFRPEPGNGLRVAALDFGSDDTIALDSIRPSPEDGWRDYVRGVLAELKAAGVVLQGGAMAIAGDLAMGTGLSSSASLEVAVAKTMTSANAEALDPVDLALIAQRAECDFVGVRCGNLDQIASAASRLGHALLIDCRSLALRHVPMPPDAVVMIVQSGVVRGLVDGEYNRRRAECETAARALGVTALRDADLDQLEAASARLDPATSRRARHVIEENVRTLAAAEALVRDDLVRMGELMRDSHRSQAENFGITVPATDRLAAILNEAIGAEGGARQTGGGFGGAVIGLMRAERAEQVRAAVLEAYRTPGGESPEIALEQACDGAGLLDPAILPKA